MSGEHQRAEVLRTMERNLAQEHERLEAGMDGAHELRLDRIEDSLKVLHTKLDRLVEDAAVGRTDIAWLKWGLRALFAAVLGVGGVAAHAAL